MKITTFYQRKLLVVLYLVSMIQKNKTFKTYQSYNILSKEAASGVIFGINDSKEQNIQNLSKLQKFLTIYLNSNLDNDPEFDLSFDNPQIIVKAKQYLKIRLTVLKKCSEKTNLEKFDSFSLKNFCEKTFEIYKNLLVLVDEL